MIKVAHRGASGYEPENTLPAFQKAVELKSDMIELDVWICKTGELVVVHDKGNVEETNFSELKALNIPALTEVLDLIDRKAKVNIELKGKNTAMSVRAVVEQYVEERGWSYDDFLISSFHHDLLKEIKEKDPEIKIGVLSAELPPRILHFAEKIKAFSINVPVDKIDEKFVEKAHGLGLKVFVYAANNDGEIQKAKDLKTDYICSNYPDKI